MGHLEQHGDGSVGQEDWDTVCEPDGSPGHTVHAEEDDGDREAEGGVGEDQDEYVKTPDHHHQQTFFPPTEVDRRKLPGESCKNLEPNTWTVKKYSKPREIQVRSEGLD